MSAIFIEPKGPLPHLSFVLQVVEQCAWAADSIVAESDMAFLATWLRAHPAATASLDAHLQAATGYVSDVAHVRAYLNTTHDVFGLIPPDPTAGAAQH